MISETRGTMTVVDLQNNNPYLPSHCLGRGKSRKQRPKFGDLLKSDHPTFSSGEEDSYDVVSANNKNSNNNVNVHQQHRHSNASASTMSSAPTSGEASPCVMSPWATGRSPLATPSSRGFEDDIFETNGLIGSIVREEGHIYSLAASGDLLYTGSDSKNIRVWKNLKDYTGFKSNSGLVKAIVIYGDRIFTGHQDGKIRVWKVSKRNPSKHKRVGTLPTFKDMVKSSVNPKHYIEARKKKNVVKVRHFDAVSCLSLNQELGLLYSASWDTTVKVWRVSDSKCLESIRAHDDAINSIVVGFDDLVLTGSADGTVKVWKRETQGKSTKHILAQILLKQENAITALAVNMKSAVIYCGSSDGLVNYWERDEKNRLSHGGSLRGHKTAVLCLATAGNLVLSGSADKNICVWRRNPDGVHVCLSVLTGHMGPVKCLAVEEDKGRVHGNCCDSDGTTAAAAEEHKGWIVYSGSLDKSVKVWRLSERTPIWREMGTPPVTTSSPQCENRKQ